MDIKKLIALEVKDGVFALHKGLLSDHFSEIASVTADSFKRYPNSLLFEKANTFIGHDLFYSFPGDLDSLAKVGFFPAAQIQFELHRAITHTSFGHYRAIYDSLRRALELSIVGVHFLSESISKDDAENWMKSETDTPMLKRSIKAINRYDLGMELNKRFSLSENIRELYRELCNIVHVKGEQYGYRELDKACVSSPIYSLSSFSEESFFLALDDYVEVVRHIALTVSILNPVILEGFPISDKFGINGPISGFLEPEQSKRVRELIPDKYLDYIMEWKETSDKIQGVRDWISQFPDISIEDLKKQLDDHDRWFQSFSQPKAEHSE
jgi:hypothetical protein